jgi:hypothetical protein
MRGEVCGPGGGRAWGGGGASGMHGGRPDSRLVGARARAKRTANMRFMLVTLEVSKLSGWLNTRASCRVEGKGTCDAGRGCGPGGGRAWGGGGASGMLGEGPIQGLWGPGHARSALRTCSPCP